MEKIKVNGTVSEVKILKDGVGKNHNGKFLKVVVDGKDYVSFDTKFLDAVGLTAEFLTYDNTYNGKVSHIIELPKPNPTTYKEHKDSIKTISEAAVLIRDSVRGVERCVEIILNSLDDIENV